MRDRLPMYTTKIQAVTGSSIKSTMMHSNNSGNHSTNNTRESEGCNFATEIQVPGQARIRTKKNRWQGRRTSATRQAVVVKKCAVAKTTIEKFNFGPWARGMRARNARQRKQQHHPQDNTRARFSLLPTRVAQDKAEPKQY